MSDHSRSPCAVEVAVPSLVSVIIRKSTDVFHWLLVTHATSGNRKGTELWYCGSSLSSTACFLFMQRNFQNGQDGEGLMGISLDISKAGVVLDGTVSESPG